MSIDMEVRSYHLGSIPKDKNAIFEDNRKT
jgi:hypothetical protein